MQVNILQAKNQLSKLIHSLDSGEEIIIAKRGKPVARLVPIKDSGTADPGNAGTILNWLKSHPLPRYAQRSAQEIDTTIQEERDSWD